MPASLISCDISEADMMYVVSQLEEFKVLMVELVQQVRNRVSSTSTYIGVVFKSYWKTVYATDLSVLMGP